MESLMTWSPVVQKHDEPMYISLVRALSEDVAAGKLPVGTRLPTQRDLADKLGVALGTITRAYSEAERRGLVYGDGRRGTFVGELPNARSYLASVYKPVSVGVDFSKNQPATAYDPDLAAALRQIVKHGDIQHLLHYPPSAGYPKHREAGLRWLESLGLKVDMEQIYISGGAQHALMAIFAAETRPGDLIATEEYTYPGVKIIAELMGLEVVGVEMDDEGMRPESLETICKHRDVRLMYCNPSYQNPTNAIMSAKRRQQIAEVADRHSITVVEDEILAPLMEKHPGFISRMLPERGYGIISSSKALAAGLRIGFIAAPKPSLRKLNESLQASILGVPPLMAEIFTRWYSDGTLEKIITRRKKEMSHAQHLASTILKGFKFRSHPTSYHIWLHLPEYWQSLQFASEAQMRGVAVTPAEIFAAERKAGLQAVRLSIGSVSDRELLKHGLEVVKSILQGATRKEALTV